MTGTPQTREQLDAALARALAAVLVADFRRRQAEQAVANADQLKAKEAA